MPPTLLTAKTRFWRRALWAIGALVLALSGSQALALSMGRVVVQSALGEPLRAEIEFLDITDE